MLFACAKSHEGARGVDLLDGARAPWHREAMDDKGGFGGRGTRIGEATAIGDLLKAAVAPAMRRMGFGKSGLVSRWGEIAGPELSPHSAPLTLRYPPGRRAGGVLDISVDATHAAALRTESAAIITRINDLYGYPAVAHLNIRPRR